MRKRWVLVAYIAEGKTSKLLAFGPFMSRENAFDYADEFHGGWSGYNIIEIQEPKY